MSLQDLKKWDPLTQEEYDEWWPLIKLIARDFVKKKFTRKSHIAIYVTESDIENELYPVLVEVLRKYDPNHPKKASLKTCINQRCRQRLVDFQRNNMWIKKVHFKKIQEKNESEFSDNELPYNYICADSEILDHQISYDPIIDEIEEKEFAEYLFNDLNLNYSKRASEILFKLYVLGQSNYSLTKEYNLNKNYIDRLIRKAKPQLIKKVEKYKKNMGNLKDIILVPGVGTVEYSLKTAYEYIDPLEKWKGKRTHFEAKATVYIGEPKKFTTAGSTKKTALNTLKESICCSRILYNLTLHFPKRTLKQHLNSKEYLEALDKYGI